MKVLRGVILLTSLVALYLISDLSSKGNHISAHDENASLKAFIDWLKQNKKIYREHNEFLYRLQKFKYNYQFIVDHNARQSQGLETFTLAVNQFADLDPIEFQHLFTGLKKTSLQVTSQCHGKINILQKIPDSYDWTDRAVSIVKNQGSCGSCWAFSTVGSLEGLAAIQKNKFYNFSSQQLVDCAGGVYHNGGCNGGEMVNALWYVIDHGITTEQIYPYTGKNGKCAYKDTMKVFTIKDCAIVPANKSAALQSALVAQPVAISVDAASAFWQFYKSGVFSQRCGTKLDHGILLTGYGSLENQLYWKCKNSWGPNWGMQGYILIQRGGDGPGECGILMENVVPQ